MKRSRKLLSFLVMIAMTVSSTVPAVAQQPGQEAAGNRQRGNIRDVRLSLVNSLRLQVTSPNGNPLGNQSVVLKQMGQELAAVVTSNDGWAELTGLRGGVYQIDVAGQLHWVRIWTARAAPPLAQPELLLVGGDSTQRGQHPLCCLLECEPIMLGVLVAAVIAIPLAVHESGNAS